MRSSDRWSATSAVSQAKDGVALARAKAASKVLLKAEARDE
jgi:hypothetical protein